MRILLSGGGTGGHVTPILAVAHELKKLKPDCYIIYIGEKGGKFASLTDGSKAIDEVHSIYAGKFRRYHGESWLRRIFDFKTNFLNLRDSFYFAIGTFQSHRLLKKLKPDVVFLKGGFVGVPVGIAAHYHKLPIVTHDSDSVPGLANRFIAKWANWHATGMPASFYSYPEDKIKYVGVLVSEVYQPINEGLQEIYKSEVGVPVKSPLLLVTGGSLGAARLNKAVMSLVTQLLQDYPDLHIIHQVGKGNLDEYNGTIPERLHIVEFMNNMYQYLGAADVVVTRAGASTLAELGVQGKACVVVPNPLLTGGHQTKNAEYLANKNAVLMVNETAEATNQQELNTAIRRLLDSPIERQSFASALQLITIKDAAQKLAMVLLETADNYKNYVQKKETTTPKP